MLLRIALLDAGVIPYNVYSIGFSTAGYDEGALREARRRFRKLFRRAMREIEAADAKARVPRQDVARLRKGVRMGEPQQALSRRTFAYRRRVVAEWILRVLKETGDLPRL